MGWWGDGVSMIRVESSVPLTHHDLDRPWITHSDPDHPKERSLTSTGGQTSGQKDRQADRQRKTDRQTDRKKSLFFKPKIIFLFAH